MLEAKESVHFRVNVVFSLFLRLIPLPSFKKGAITYLLENVCFLVVTDGRREGGTMYVFFPRVKEPYRKKNDERRKKE